MFKDQDSLFFQIGVGLVVSILIAIFAIGLKITTQSDYLQTNMEEINASLSNTEEKVDKLPERISYDIDKNK